MALRFNIDEIFSIGVEIEKNGCAFYSTSANSTDDPVLKKLFAQLAEWEKSHIALFENLRLKLPSSVKEDNVFDQDNLIHLYLKAVSDNNVFVKGLALDPDNFVWTSPITVLNTALDFEKDSVVYYSSMKELTTEKTGSIEVEKIIVEELKHIGFITVEIRKLGG
jgi:rubrerythrin